MDKAEAAKDATLESVGVGAFVVAGAAASAGEFTVAVASAFIGVLAFTVKYITRG